MPTMPPQTRYPNLPCIRQEIDPWGLQTTICGGLLFLAALFGLTWGQVEAQEVRFEQGFSGCVDVVVTAAAPFDGAELAWQYSGLSTPSVVAGPDLPVGAFLVVNHAPSNGCSDNRPGVAVGIVVGTTPLPAGEHRLLEVCHPLPSTVTALCGSLDLVDCLGSPPILNRLFPGPIDLQEVDGEACFFERPFRRGDLDGSGDQTVSDAVAILHCLFLQDRCPGCFDAADANDDGFADISDVVYLLSWRVGLVPALPPPAAACGTDPTPDQFLCPERGGPACAWTELRWDPPLLKEDGSPLDQDALAGFRVYSGPEPREYDQVADVGLTTRALWSGVPAARRYFAVTALDVVGLESGFSEEALKEF